MSMSLTLRTPKEARSYLQKQVNYLFYKPAWLVRNCNYVINLPHFNKWFGSSVDTDHSHHAYPGGLIIHTAEVMEGALQKTTGKDDLSIIVPAVIFHDLAKLHDYNVFGEKTLYRKLIRHVAGSYAEWHKMTMGFGAEDYELYLKIGHCILSHHGKLEWGSPVTPQIHEAEIIHQADMESMQNGPGKFPATSSPSPSSVEVT